jgi:hypothetical protein
MPEMSEWRRQAGSVDEKKTSVMSSLVEDMFDIPELIVDSEIAFSRRSTPLLNLMLYSCAR